MAKNILLLMMGGSGTRFGAALPKQFVEVNNKPVFSYIIEKYSYETPVHALVIVCHESWLSYADEWITKVIPSDFPYCITAGGASRSESVRNGLQEAKGFTSDDDIVLIHDATHPYVDVENLDAVIDAAKRHGGATLGEKQYDTVYGIDPDTNMLQQVIPRDTVVAGASPEAFLFEKIYGLYQSLSLEELETYSSAGALALANGMEMEIIPTDLINLKITYKKDMEAFEKLFHDYYF